MNRKTLVLVALALLVGATSAFAQTRAFQNMGAGKAMDVSADGTLVGGNDGSGGYLANNGVKTVYGGSVAGVEYVGGVPTAVGSSGGAAIGQAGAWSALPLAGGTTAWTPTGIGVGASDYWVSGTGGSAASLYTNSAGTTAVVGGPAVNTGSRLTEVSNTGAYAGAANYTGNAWNAYYGSPNAWLNTDAGSAGPGVQGEAYSISSDGQVKVGWGWAADGGWTATYWDNADGNVPHLLPQFRSTIDDYWWTEATACNADGSFIGALSIPSSMQEVAWVWDATNGRRSVESWLVNEMGVASSEISGWVFEHITGISDDGLSMCGWGLYNGVETGWSYSVVPEPATMMLLGIGGLLLRRRR